ncbi:hypothetical protein GCM10009117_06940 [Gangjinia marincola]|uniref:Lipocalin-like domain-containing protein n=1 Tax=Gangjinia marincola TaxID=578463 RepID=A0ABN1MF95_9FLAO
MKKVNALLLGLFVAFSFSCGDDDDGGPSGPQEEDFVGVWALANVEGNEDQETTVGNNSTPFFNTTINDTNDTDFTLDFTADPNTVEAEGTYTLISQKEFEDGSEDEFTTVTYVDGDEFSSSWSYNNDTDEVTFSGAGGTRTYTLTTINDNSLVLTFENVVEVNANNAITTTRTEITYTFTKQ